MSLKNESHDEDFFIYRYNAHVYFPFKNDQIFIYNGISKIYFNKSVIEFKNNPDLNDTNSFIIIFK